MSRIIPNFTTATSSHCRMASNVILVGDFDISFKFWMRTTTTQVLLGHYPSNSHFIANVDGVLRIRIAGGTIESAAILEASKYYTCRVTRVGTTVTGYIDGVSVATGTSSADFYLDAIGIYNNGALGIDGYMADVDLGDYAWTLDEASAATEASTPPGNTITYTNLPAAQRYTFTESSGSEYWWGTNGENLELDVQQPAADAYMIAGQSNAQGRAAIEAGVDDVYSTLNGRVMQFGYTSQLRYGATNPLDHNGEVAGTMGFWRETCLGLSASNLLMIPCAKGGTGFGSNDWNPPTDPSYAAAVATTNAGMLSNSNNTLKAMIWLQGETDGDLGRTQAQYLADIQAMRTAMITDITDMTADTPWVCIEIGKVGAAYDLINAALAEFVASIPEGYLIPNTDLTLQDVDHYDTASLRTIGTRVAAALEPAVVDDGYFNDVLSSPLKPALSNVLS